MLIVKGIPASAGIVLGPAIFSKTARIIVQPEKVIDAKKELDRFVESQKEGIRELDELYQEAVDVVGEEMAQIFDIHKMMIEAEEFADRVQELICEEKFCAPYAVQKTAGELAAMFSATEDKYMKERAADVVDISERLIRIMLGLQTTTVAPQEKCILLADDFLPSDTIRLDTSKVLAFVTKFGSHTSHLSILARTRGITAVVGLGEDAYSQIKPGDRLIVDGDSGEIMIDPDTERIQQYEQKRQQLEASKQELQKYKGVKSQTVDGTTIEVCANIGSVADLDSVLANDADGIGLVRSEFLYMECDEMPSEETLFEAYRECASRMDGKRVIIRTLDIGADKPLPYLDLGHEDNPAIGFRAIRVCLKKPELFADQLRAILRASAYGNVAIMFPMISGLPEFLEGKQEVLRCMDELRKRGVAFDEHIQIGMMIEVPAAAVMSDVLAEHADFFSIGTNDLTQFTLAADRTNPQVDFLFNSPNEAVLRLIELTAQNAQKHHIMCGICGEMGANLNLTERFLKMGIRELSVTPRKILEVRKKVCSIELNQNENN